MDIKSIYNRLASTYDKDHFEPNSAAEYVEMRRLKLIYSYLKNSEGLMLLDVACGTGTYLSIAKEHGAQVVGCDISEEMIRACRKKGLSSALVNDYHSLPFKDNTFDLVLCVNAVHYARHPERVVSEMQRVLKDGGLILFTYFNVLNFRSINRVRKYCNIDQPINYERRYSPFHMGKLMESMTPTTSTGINLLPFRSSNRIRSEKLLSICHKVEDLLESTICKHFFNETFLVIEKPLKRA